MVRNLLGPACTQGPADGRQPDNDLELVERVAIPGYRAVREHWTIQVDRIVLRPHIALRRKSILANCVGSTATSSTISRFASTKSLEAFTQSNAITFPALR